MSSNSSEKFYDALQEEPLNIQKKWTPLHIAARDGNLGEVKNLLLDSNIDVNNAENAYGMTPLHLAAENGYIDIVKALLKQPGINPEKKDNLGRTAFDLAKNKGYTKVVNAFQDEALANKIYKLRRELRSLDAQTHSDSKGGGRRKSRRATKLKRKRRTKRRRR